MQKPLARYADDQDLENLLKSKIRDGDPMLEYITKNKGSGEDSPDGVRHGKSIKINNFNNLFLLLLIILVIFLQAMLTFSINVCKF